ncbi:hypothetical protein AB1E33_11285 [Ruegeria sp. 2012CJ15-1]
MLTHIEGLPVVGMTIYVAGVFGTIKELGRNSTDRQVVSSRDCLTGRPCASYGSILVEWNEGKLVPKDLCQMWVQEEVVN